jgi:glycosyltransferase involved in cell wall biosynthesis
VKILISAFACEPGQGSEPGVGWNTAVNLARSHDVWVVTYEHHRPGIERELRARPVPRLRVVYYRTPVVFDRLNRGFEGVGANIHYYLWQIGAAGVAHRLARSVPFDLVLHTTYVRYWQPSFFHRIAAPFVWGPVGGGDSAPVAFYRDLHWRGRVFELARDAARWVGEHDPFVRQAARRSTVCLATTRATAARLERLGARRVEVAGESALSAEDLEQLSRVGDPPAGRPTFLSTGRLLHWKGFQLGIRAFASARIPSARYIIVGDGPERQRLAELAQRLGVGDSVEFTGRVSRAEALERLREAHVLVHPSFHDSGGWVCLEAMAAGRPVLCLDLGGPGEQVTAETGIKVAATSPEQAVADLADAMRRLASDDEGRARMGRAGRARVRTVYTWDVKLSRLLDLLGDRAPAHPHQREHDTLRDAACGS